MTLQLSRVRIPTIMAYERAEEEKLRIRTKELIADNLAARALLYLAPITLTSSQFQIRDASREERQILIPKIVQIETALLERFQSDGLIDSNNVLYERATEIVGLDPINTERAILAYAHEVRDRAEKIDGFKFL